MLTNFNHRFSVYNFLYFCAWFAQTFTAAKIRKKSNTKYDKSIFFFKKNFIVENQTVMEEKKLSAFEVMNELLAYSGLNAAQFLVKIGEHPTTVQDIRGARPDTRHPGGGDHALDWAPRLRRDATLHEDSGRAESLGDAEV